MHEVTKMLEIKIAEMHKIALRGFCTCVKNKKIKKNKLENNLIIKKKKK